jgi:uncharacterized membrane protein HdeD (DUF308 family)
MIQPTTPTDLPGMKSMRKNWGWFLALGIALLIFGWVALGAAFLTTLVFSQLFGALLFVGGIFQVAHAIFARRWWGSAINLITGLLYVVFGWLIIKHPIESLEVLTILIAAFLLGGGAVRIALAITQRGDSWFWMALSGVIDVLLGLIIWEQMPESSFIVIGLFVGITMIFNGVSWIMIAVSVRNLDEDEEEEPAAGA